jgi:hypothetical protein
MEEAIWSLPLGRPGQSIMKGIWLRGRAEQAAMSSAFWSVYFHCLISSKTMNGSREGQLFPKFNVNWSHVTLRILFFLYFFLLSFFFHLFFPTFHPSFLYI